SGVVFFVALPLCMGIALASGMPVQAGLLTGIIGGLVVGLLSGAPMQVSGPAAGLLVLAYAIVHKEGPAGLAIVLVLAGAMQIAAGLSKAAQWFRIVSPAVIQGMLAGIGAVILLGQLQVMMGTRAHAGGLDNLLALPQTLVDAFLPARGFEHAYAGLVGLLTITALVLWQENFKKKTAL